MDGSSQAPVETKCLDFCICWRLSKRNITELSVGFLFFFFSVCYKFILRTQDLKTKKHHIPVVDRTPLEPPPVVVVVVGPPKVGKSTLIKCLIKNFTRQKLVEIRGPVTIVSGENKDTRNWNAYFTLLNCLTFIGLGCVHILIIFGHVEEIICVCYQECSLSE